LRMQVSHLDRISNCCKRFIQLTLSKHAEHRPSAMEALTSPWITGLSDHQALLQHIPPPNGSAPGHVRRRLREARAASVCLERATEIISGPIPSADNELATKRPLHVHGQCSAPDCSSCSDLLHQQQSALGRQTSPATEQMPSKESYRRWRSWVNKEINQRRVFNTMAQSQHGCQPLAAASTYATHEKCGTKT